MKASQLRDLAREHASGKLKLEEYRRKRGKFIRDVISGDTDVKYRDLKPAPARAKSLVNRKGILISGVLLAGLLAAAFIALQFSSKQDETPQPVQETSKPKVPEAEQALENFVKANDWSTQSLAAFETRWQGFSAFQKENARRSLWFRRLQFGIRERIKEQRTLAELESNLEAGLAEARLRLFAENLGITL
ncbi:MAG: hypothetical protein MJA83_03145 [Gammaproteobacteria bacterium]|nr:hypothetical protein [Gammaproteobacteria bacterium]